MKISVVSHCHRYPRLLAYQLTSLCNCHVHAGDAVEVVVFYSLEDEPVCRMLGWFLDQQWPCGVTLRPWAIDAPRLMRRAIGRNMAARELDADWLLYADVDYVFGPNVFFDAPAALSAVKGPLAYVHYITWPIEQADGDRLIERVTAPGFYHYIPGEFPSRTEPEPGRAIGGNQWARGEVVRKTGYVPWGRYQRPASTWQRTYEDAVFRRQLKTSGEPIELDGVYRIRHTLRGRYDIGVQL